MSQPENRTITCPECGAEIEFTLWKSINTDMDFAIDDIISGELFEVECESCGHVTRVDYPMLFNDMIHHVMISYERPTGEQEQDNDSIGMFAKFMAQFYRNGIRVVDTQNKLMEKVSIFKAGLDDHVIEIYKYSLMVMFIQQNPSAKLSIPAYYCYSEDDPKFQLIANDRHSFFAPFDKDMYDKLEMMYKKSQANAGDIIHDAVIDYEWAKKYVEEIMLPMIDEE